VVPLNVSCTLTLKVLNSQLVGAGKFRIFSPSIPFPRVAFLSSLPISSCSVPLFSILFPFLPSVVVVVVVAVAAAVVVVVVSFLIFIY